MYFDTQRKLNGHYIRAGIKSHMDIVDCYKHNFLGMRDFLKPGNITFPLPIGNYCLKNTMMDSSRGPPLLPAGEYILEQYYFANDINFTTIYVYESVIYPSLYAGIH